MIRYLFGRYGFDAELDAVLVLPQSLLAGSGISIALALANFAVHPLAMFLIPEVQFQVPGHIAGNGRRSKAIGLGATTSPALRSFARRSGHGTSL